jgi:hypothetical protein
MLNPRQNTDLAPRHDVRFGSKADICSAKGHVRFTPESDIKCDIWICPLRAKIGHCWVLFERLVSELLKLQRDTKTKPLCSFQVDYQKIF